MDPLQRPELQILLEEAARHAPQLLPVLAEQLEQRGSTILNFLNQLGMAQNYTGIDPR